MHTVDLEPARWIWLPSRRALANSFVLFRRVVQWDGELESAQGWITADSRYTLYVNGERIQAGPAPCDPREQDVDPIDLRGALVPGENVIAVEVLYYGHGDGT